MARPTRFKLSRGLTSQLGCPARRRQAIGPRSQSWDLTQAPKVCAQTTPYPPGQGNLTTKPGPLACLCQPLALCFPSPLPFCYHPNVSPAPSTAHPPIKPQSPTHPQAQDQAFSRARLTHCSPGAQWTGRGSQSAGTGHGQKIRTTEGSQAGWLEGLRQRVTREGPSQERMLKAGPE